MFSFLCIFTTVTVAVYCDTKSGKIPNVLCLYSIVIAAIHTCIDREYTFKFFLAGVCIPLILLLWMYKAKIIGAGDIKLYCAVGAFVGVKILRIICLSFCIAAIIGLIRILKRVVIMIFSHSGEEREGAEVFRLTTICFSIPIAIGTCGFCVMEVLCGKI